MSIKYFFLPLFLHFSQAVYANHTLDMPLTIAQTQQDSAWNNLITATVESHTTNNFESLTAQEFKDFYFTPDHRTAITKGGFKYAQYEEVLDKFFRTWLSESYTKLTYAKNIYIHIPSFKENLNKAFKNHARYAELKAVADIILEQCTFGLNYLGDRPVSLHVVLETFRAYLASGMYTLKEQPTYNTLKKSLSNKDANVFYNLLSTEFNPFKIATDESLIFAKSVDNIINFRINYLHKAADSAFENWEDNLVTKATISTVGIDIEGFLASIRQLQMQNTSNISNMFYTLFKEQLFNTVINVPNFNTWLYNLGFYKDLFKKNITDLLNTPYFLLALEKNKGQENLIYQEIAQITTQIFQTLESHSFNTQAEQYQFGKILAMDSENLQLSFLVNIRSIQSEAKHITYSLTKLTFNEKTITYKGKTYTINVTFFPKLEDNSGTILYQFLEKGTAVASLPLSYKIAVRDNFNINFAVIIDEQHDFYKDQIDKNSLFKDLLEQIVFL